MQQFNLNQSLFIDQDVLDTIQDFVQNAHTRDIVVELINIKAKYDVPELDELIIDQKQ